MLSTFIHMGRDSDELADFFADFEVVYNWKELAWVRLVRHVHHIRRLRRLWASMGHYLNELSRRRKRELASAESENAHEV